jgi:hypothetical protein
LKRIVRIKTSVSKRNKFELVRFIASHDFEINPMNSPAEKNKNFHFCEKKNMNLTLLYDSGRQKGRKKVIVDFNV